MTSNKSKSIDEEIVVIGGGLMGSSAAWQLSQLGAKVRLIESQAVPYTQGSSFGEARISRSLGPKEDIFSYLQQRAVIEAEKLIGFLNERDSEQMHSMDDLYRTAPVTYLYYDSQAAAVDALLQGQEDPHQFASDKKQAAELFAMRVSDSARVIREYKKYSGNLKPAELIKKLHRGVILSGNTVRYQEKVVHLERDATGFELQTKNTQTGEAQNLRCQKVICAAGPYNSMVLRNIAPYLNQVLHPKRVFLTFFTIAPKVYRQLSVEEKECFRICFPFIHMNAEFFYAMVENFDEQGTPLLKAGGHLLRYPIKDLDQVWKLPPTPGEVDWSRKQLADYLAMLNLPVKKLDLILAKGYSCVYTMTDTEVPFVTPLLDAQKKPDRNIVLVGGMSGIGAKGSLTYGLLAAHQLLEREEEGPMYRKTKNALGCERLLEYISALSDLNEP